MSLLCSDNPERRLTLKRGASALRLEQNCHIKADGWSISSVAQLSSRVSVELSLISIPQIPIFKMISQTTLDKHLKNPIWQAMGEVKNIN